MRRWRGRRGVGRDVLLPPLLSQQPRFFRLVLVGFVPVARRGLVKG